MKIGIFGDVHGHLAELQQTLDLLQAHSVEGLICTGDLVDKGQHSAAVVELMMTQAIPCVQGNHDAKAQFFGAVHDQPLPDRAVVYLSQLPVSLSFHWAGITAYVCHSNPWEDSSVYVYPTRPLLLFQQIVAAVDAQVIIMGHTHHPMRVQVGQQTILNPGSIYGNRDRPERTCGVLTLPALDFDLYDIDNGEKLPL